MSAMVRAVTHVQRIGVMRKRLTDLVPEPPRSTHGQTPDHRRPQIWTRAKARTQRRAFIVLAAIDRGDPEPELARLVRLMGEADSLAEKI